MAFAHGAQDQPGAGELQHRPDPGDQRDAEVEDDVMGEQDRPDYRDVGQRAEIDIAQPGRFDPDVALADQRREAEAKEGE